MSAATSTPIPVKIVVAGGFGVGKTTLVGAVSEIVPLTTEAAMTSASVGIDDTSVVSVKTTTTVAMDFGRITLNDDVVLYLFGTPGQDRFWFMWDELVVGRSARWCSWTPAGWPSRSPRSTTSRSGTCPSWSPSTVSTAPCCTVRRTSATRWTLTPACRSSSATRGCASRPRGSCSSSCSTRSLAAGDTRPAAPTR